MPLTLAQIAERIGVELRGSPEELIYGLGTLEAAEKGQLTHCSSRHYLKYLPQTCATAVIVAPEHAEQCPTHTLVSTNPALAYSRASQLFEARPRVAEGVDPRASVSEDAKLGTNVRIGPFVFIGSGVRVGSGVEIAPGAVVEDGVTIGEDCLLGANSVVCYGVSIGARCVLLPGAIVGSDGFGFTPDQNGKLHAIAQLGSVRVGDEVVVGAGACIDRGAIGDTEIGDGVKLDNLVQIGHNCRVGDHSILCGCAGIAGSTTLGPHTVLAGGVGVAGDRPVNIAGGVTVSAMSFVSGSISEPGVYSAALLHNKNSKWRRNALRFQELDEIAKRLARIESVIEERSND